MFFYGYGTTDVLQGTFWHICIISAPVRFSSIFSTMSWCMSLKLHVNKKSATAQAFQREHLGFPGKTRQLLALNMTLLSKKQWWLFPAAVQLQRGASRAPWSLLHLLLFTASLCSPRSISSDTASIPLSLAWGRQNQGRHCLMCVHVCVCFVLPWWWRQRRSVAPTKWCSQAWNHLSSALKGLHGFLMMSPYLLYAKYTQWLHSF